MVATYNFGSVYIRHGRKSRCFCFDTLMSFFRDGKNLFLLIVSINQYPTC